jgi:protein required for attachment to host cells
VVAPPAMLGNLRKMIKPEVRNKIIAEIDKDLTKHSVYEIEKHLTG